MQTLQEDHIPPNRNIGSWKDECENEEQVPLRDDLNCQDSYGYTALSYAVISQRTLLVRLILERDDVRTDSKWPWGETPLQVAVRYGNIRIVKMLLQRDDVQADSRDAFGQTPLSAAAGRGDGAVVKLFLERNDVKADSRDICGRTPLHLAANSGSEAVVELLLRRDDVKADSKDTYGQTPLHLAAGSEKEALAELLQGDDAQVDSGDEASRKSSSHAAGCRFEKVVKRLLSDDVQADSSDEYGRTPLSYAASSGYEGIAKRLLQYNVQPEFKDKRGRTPLSHAAEQGNESLVELLLQQSGVKAETKDIDGRTPLAYAIECSREAVVRLLLQQTGPKISHNSDLSPPFLRAIIGEGERVAELIPQSDPRRAAIMAYHEKGQKKQNGFSLSGRWAFGRASNDETGRAYEAVQWEKYDEKGCALEAVRREMALNCVWRNRVTFVVDWELPDCMSKEYDGSVKLGHLLILVGSARQAYSTKCSEYLQSNWPKTWKICLAAVEETLHGKENISVIYSQSNLSIAITRAADFPLVMQIMGSPEAILEVAQQLVFIAANFRLSSDHLSLSDCFLESEATEVFRLGLSPLKAVPYESNMCWHPLFVGSIIVRGFPMPSRADEVGVELPYSVMLAFARILYPVEFAGGLLLKGFDTLLVPTARRNSSIQWHFIQEESSNDTLTSYVRRELTGKRRPKRLPTWAIKDHVRDWIQLRSLDDILDKRMFLGFCNKVRIHLGTKEANFGSIGYSSSSQRAGRSFEISGGTASFAFASQNLPGPTLAVNFGFSRCQAAVKNFTNVSYVELLHILKRTPVILYDDDNEVKKAWLVSALSTVLHMIHVWAERSPELASMDGQKLRLPFAKVASDGGQAALDAFLANDNSLLKLHAVPGGEPYRLKDLVNRIWGNMESVIEELERQKPLGIRLERSRKLRGWQFMDMVKCQPLHRPREHRIERSGDGWFPLAQDIMVLFCSGIGDVVQPETGAQTCRSWWPVPPKKDYMVASLCSLSHQTGACSSTSQARSAIIDGFYWNPRLLLNLDHDCSKAKDDRCNILQELTRGPAQNDYSYGELEEEFLSGYFREGAVVLGRRSRLEEFSHFFPRRRRHPVAVNIVPATHQNEPVENITGALALELRLYNANVQGEEPTPPTTQEPAIAQIDTNNALGLSPPGVAT